MSRHLLAAKAICSFSTIENVRYHGNVDLLTQTFSVSYLREGGEDGTESPRYHPGREMSFILDHSCSGHVCLTTWSVGTPIRVGSYTTVI